ncbi:vacuolar sorting-associated protein [Niveomyces insectorum RCEF 264]|uniref:Vacuolar sorting-associated protein n=1 Tax=Niveomyces insectorum RCEF 264 TaxID=1081102 RepID=A0A167Y677_9HYPO|nr:vacuolar sorting-associated protein [Niveomyces insectorum RCEF 264]
MHHFRRVTFIVVFVGFVVFLLWLLPRVLNPTPPTRDEKRRDKDFVDSSPYWVDRQACRLLGLCGVHHLRWDAPSLPDNGTNNGGDGGSEPGGDLRRLELRSLFATSDDYKWLSRESVGDESWEIAGRNLSDQAKQLHQPGPDASAEVVTAQDDVTTTTKDRQGPRRAAKASTLRDVPGYVLDHAPLVHLFSGENFWPSHIAEHIKHMIPYTNGTAVDHPSTLTLDNLYLLNNHSTEVFLTSEVDVETRPAWLHNRDGIPFPFDEDGGDGDGNHDDDDNDGDGNDGDDNGGSGGDRGGIPGGDKSVKNGHDYEQPHRPFKDGTTWYSVDKEHPLNRIADPRKLPGMPREGSLPKPYDARLLRRLRQQALLGRDDSSTNDKDKPKNKIAHDLGSDQKPLTAVFGHKPDAGGYSRAPAILVLVDKGSGILDAFWFFFYSYNLGQTVLKVRYGNHVGDWEHCMMRFENGVPRALYLSEHAGGQAYAWNAVEKFYPKSKGGDEAAPRPPARPVIYSAVGSHAMYALPGMHPYVLPFKMLRDETDKGPLWDPAKNHLAYHYDYVADQEWPSRCGGGRKYGKTENEHDDGTVPVPVPHTSLVPASSNPNASTGWFHFWGFWGDDLYPLGDRRQWRLFGQYHYVTGPDGPKFKNLGRVKVCETMHCRILYSLDAGKKASWYS